MEQQNKKNKTFKKSLLAAAFAVIGSAIALTSVTYAWFTMGDNAKVDELDLTVTSADGIQVSVDGINWKSTVTKADLAAASGTYATAVNQFPSSGISPVSSAFEYAEGKQKMFLGSLSDGLLGSKAEVETNGTGGQFIAFDLFFNVGSSKDLYLDAGSIIKDGVVDQGGANAAYASRISFTFLGTADTPTAAQALKTAGTPYVWEPYYDSHTTYVTNNFKPEVIEAQNSGYNALQKAFAAKAVGQLSTSGEAELKAVTTKHISQHPADDPAGQPTYYKGETTAATKLFTIGKGINKVRIYIWLEGQDIDCNNDISNTKLLTTLKFKQQAVA